MAQPQTGHAFIKQTMRSQTAIYGGEMSAHHYFRDFAYCDSGMIPWLLVAELLPRSSRSLGHQACKGLDAFPSLGEKNFKVDDPDAAIDNVMSAYRETSLQLDETDDISLAFYNWHFNVTIEN